MQYKVRYRPLEQLGPDGWSRMPDGEQAARIASIAAEQPGAGPEGGSKDGAPGEQRQYRFV
jgi:arginine-tRNA-protein transferase